jgi:hypothetical protein
MKTRRQKHDFVALPHKKSLLTYKNGMMFSLKKFDSDF